MSVLRENRDSVMAMLEAFVYDPLISWRLLTNQEAPVDKIITEDSDDNPSVIDKITEELVNNSNANSYSGIGALLDGEDENNQQIKNNSGIVIFNCYSV